MRNTDTILHHFRLCELIVKIKTTHWSYCLFTRTSGKVTISFEEELLINILTEQYVSSIRYTITPQIFYIPTK